MPAFISYSSGDREAVRKLAEGLRDRGTDCWWDRWQIGPGDDIVSAINTGLEKAGAGIIVFSRHSRESRWVEAEASYLTYARIQENKVVIPVKVDAEAWVPPLLRPLAWRLIGEIDAIAEALQNRKPAAPGGERPAEFGRVERVTISLREENGAIRVDMQAGGREYGSHTLPALPRALLDAQKDFLAGFRTGARSPETAERTIRERNLVELGRELRALCLPGDSGEALASLVDGCPVGTSVEVCFEAAGSSPSKPCACPMTASSPPGRPWPCCAAWRALHGKAPAPSPGRSRSWWL